MNVFIHIGTHKTGTTSIQAFLRSHARELAQSGILVPLVGTLSESSGHHNLAFQLNGDSRYDSRLGRLSELVDELRHSTALRAVISSEDFSGLVDRPDRVQHLESTLRRAGHSVTWVMFIRRVDDYSESLYTTMWGSGVRPRFGYPGFVLSILAYGKYSQNQRFGGSVHYCDFTAFVRRWREASESRLLLRDYDQAVSAEGLLPCFLKIIAAPDTLLVAAETDSPRLNGRIERITRRYRRWLRPLLMARFHNSNLSLING
ncbi:MULTISPECIES: hypothetical protein [unclassified Cyanobium]|uniref:hypothetical protein n=1 Tax=unclassified Cyanobium TaxID=2627006 RepID=UPI0020CD073E|nr:MULTISPECIES: hypothetical protein [unclassified Cyanobium]MCP9833464.1 hypothetical protein [Cyanobium sp. La Preciosa 7G6]MCP9936229.1 hypothetical protein [Cyanobium sp. Aljojuca 7A6]